MVKSTAVILLLKCLLLFSYKPKFRNLLESTVFRWRMVWIHQICSTNCLVLLDQILSFTPRADVSEWGVTLNATLANPDSSRLHICSWVLTLWHYWRPAVLLPWRRSITCREDFSAWSVASAGALWMHTGPELGGRSVPPDCKKTPWMSAQEIKESPWKSH